MALECDLKHTFVCPRYESTSSEDEEDGSSSVESGEGEGMDSTEEDEAALDEETSEEERNVNVDESDTDEETLRGTTYSCAAVKEKYAFLLFTNMCIQTP